MDFEICRCSLLESTSAGVPSLFAYAGVGVGRRASENLKIIYKPFIEALNTQIINGLDVDLFKKILPI
ncbi:MAG: hypothetical protein MUE85_20465 [Microscillaceae bacterium]|jgi:hypothetical protein|nr:hypothetical protein [Microscillaceae bacterium]